ncbi:hypothetical protein ACSNOK_03775 [Streptomyces sp. URMC 126]|uniref:hypothetical protein n=1 Tax=Streptomyces sp. URMC 126 TaxID=3423401 RepID=UPI003F1AD414
MTGIRMPAAWTGKTARNSAGAPRPHVRDGTVALVVAALVVLEASALRLVPVADWPPATLALGVALATVAVTVHTLGRRSARVRRDRRPPAPGGALFDAATRAGCPLDALRPGLPPSDPTAENRLCAAWILAHRGHDALWLSRHLDLPEGVADALVRAARADAGDPGGTAAGRPPGEQHGGPPRRRAPTMPR